MCNEADTDTAIAMVKQKLPGSETLQNAAGALSFGLPKRVLPLIPKFFGDIEKEANSENLSIRDRKTGAVRELAFDEFITEINEQTKDKPFTGLNFPKHISKRPNLMV